MFNFDENYLLNEKALLNKKIDNAKSEVHKMMDDIKFKAKAGQLTPKVLKELVNKIYKQSPEQLISDLPSIGELVRLTIMVGIPSAVNPLFGIFGYIADRVIKENVNEKEIGRYIGTYKRQIIAMDKKIASEKDPKKKEQYQKALNDLEKSLDKLEDKKRDLEEYKDAHHKYESFDESYIDNEILSQYNQFVEMCILYNLYDDDSIISESGVNRALLKTKQTVKNTERKMDTWFEDSLQGIKKTVNKDSRDSLVKGSFPQLSKMIKRASALGVAYAINPAIAGIGLVVSVAIKKRVSQEEKAKLLRELKEELEIVDEKIKDADSSGDRKKKYELMRLKNKLNTDIDRLKRYI